MIIETQFTAIRAVSIMTDNCTFKPKQERRARPQLLKQVTSSQELTHHLPTQHQEG